MIVHYELTSEEDAAVTSVVTFENTHRGGSPLDVQEYLDSILRQQLDQDLRAYRKLVFDGLAGEDLSLVKNLAKLSVQDKATIAQAIDDLAVKAGGDVGVIDPLVP